jgi:mycothiol maleylpyruvate isomerase-like protein
VVARIHELQAEWRALVAEVGEDRMLEPGPMGDWTFKDLAAHLLGWREWTLTRLEAASVSGGPAPVEPWPKTTDDPDGINEWIQEQNADRSVADVLQDIDRSYDRLAAALGALPEALLTDPAGLPWLDGTAAADVDWVSHLHVEHEASIRDWLQRRG